MLNRIVAQTRQAVAEMKKVTPLETLKSRLTSGKFAFSTAIANRDWTLIAECKLASPAKGILCKNYTVPELAAIFAANGAAALSVHTNAAFHGCLDDIRQVKAVVSLPVLCKEFVIDEYQLYAASAAGADAILLIAAVLSDSELHTLSRLAARLGLDCLVEVHTLAELNRVRQAGTGLVGINNRDLQTFTTNIDQTFSLLPACEPGWLIISESGIKNGEDALRLKEAGVKGILVGEGLVTAPDMPAKTCELALHSLQHEGRCQNA